ncbi:hypothetical protein CY34DRAFT_106606 [Suillus luteus UH-Slu-Lm8-n1]|uniref:Uncharacterized protein n=1 Tax=Suillus luteus UH-Slu-Lm8-n1 TaxID=930992 RepID=A0A0D0AMN6_9AGAM|nr:hypothetical protein CY34DRAFT_106606 [Suillus luteus UH-Slu-Lm8-n1]
MFAVLGVTTRTGQLATHELHGPRGDSSEFTLGGEEYNLSLIYIAWSSACKRSALQDGHHLAIGGFNQEDSGYKFSKCLDIWKNQLNRSEATFNAYELNAVNVCPE